MVNMRRVTLTLALLISVLLLPPMAFAQEESLLPRWGTSAVSVYTIPSTGFAPYQNNNITPWGPGDTGIVCNDFSGGSCRLGASFHLPSGTRIIGLELEACDAVATGQVSLRLLSCPINTNSCATLTTVTSADTGCATTSSTVLDVTINNGNTSYLVIATITDNTIGVLLRAARIRYQLQVSPAPAVASFQDVPTNHPFFPFIEALKASGITGGCQASPPLFCPDDPLTRGQMATFLSLGLGLHFEP